MDRCKYSCFFLDKKNNCHEKKESKFKLITNELSVLAKVFNKFSECKKEKRKHSMNIWWWWSWPKLIWTERKIFHARIILVSYLSLAFSIQVLSFLFDFDLYSRSSLYFCAGISIFFMTFYSCNLALKFYE